MIAYKIYVKTDYSDNGHTIMPDIRFEEIGYESKLDNAVIIANGYIDVHFNNKMLLSSGTGNIIYHATDIGFPSRIVLIERIIIN